MTTLRAWTVFPAVLTLALAAAAQEKPNAPGGRPAGIPDLVGGLKASPGCLGVETAKTGSGKQVIFAWFEDKKAVLAWFYSDTHMKAMKMFFSDHKPGKPLADLPDDSGPIMAVASITPGEKSAVPNTSIPISQISIELYRPLGGGLFVGGRFAPEGLKVPGMRDYTPPKTN